jgi:hypothetical protein
MMQEQNYKDYDQEGLNFLGSMQRPIPGQSLTNNPDNPYPWEQPPQFTELQPAIDALFIDMTEPESYSGIVQMARRGTPISDITQFILYAGFQEGNWNPDLMMLLIEPTMYLIMALVERAGVLDYTIYRGEEEEDFDDDEEQLSAMEKVMATAKEKIKEPTKGQIPSGVLPSDIMEQIKEVEVPESLLAQPEQGLLTKREV